MDINLGHKSFSQHMPNGQDLKDVSHTHVHSWVMGVGHKSFSEQMPNGQDLEDDSRTYIHTWCSRSSSLKRI